MEVVGIVVNEHDIAIEEGSIYVGLVVSGGPLYLYARPVQAVQSEP
jgi:hypothetical protein